MAKKERQIEPRRELSDLIHGNWEAAHHAIGSLLPATIYALGLKVMEVSNPTLSAGEAVATGVAGSFALRYSDELINFLIPQMQRESYTRKNQRETILAAGRAGTAIAAGVILSYVTDSPFAYAAIASVASFMTGKSATEKMPEMKYSTAVPISTFLLGSCLHLSMSGFETTATIIKENVVQNKENVMHVEGISEEPEVKYAAKPPFNTWPARYDGVRLVNSCFGDRGRRSKKSIVSQHHRGIDIQAPWNTPIVSVGNGIVAKVYLREGTVQINHGDGIFTEYGHLDRVYVKEGDLLLAGEQIGLSGGSSNGKNGPSTGPHLHFMIDDEGVSPYLQDASGNAAVLQGKVNPLCYMNEDIGFTVAKKSGCNTQGGENKYCGLYKSPIELVVDIEEKYGEIVRRYVDPKKLDPGLVYALIAQESRGEPEAGSKTGAYGPMQFTPATAFVYGLCDNKKCHGRDDRTNPEISISAGVSYYERLQEEFKDYADKDIFAIAAYNAGSELIRRAIENTEWSNPTWEQVSVMITQDLVGDVDGTGNINMREKKALEIKEHVSNVKGYYSFYLVAREQSTIQVTENRDTDATRIREQ